MLKYISFWKLKWFVPYEQMHTFKENKVGREQISWNKIHHGHKQKSFVAKGIKIEKM